MALSEEELMQQLNVLATKTSDNKKMVYNSVEGLNKGLNPDIFYGNGSKIVNAINKVAGDVGKLETAIVDVMRKINVVMSDLNDDANQELYKDLQNLMGKENLVEGIMAILEGKQQEKVLGISESDAGKMLSVVIDEITGKAVVKPIELPSINIDEIIIASNKVTYTNESKPEINNVEQAINHLIEKVEEPVKWENIENRPDVEGIEASIEQILSKMEEPVKWEDIEDKPNIENMEAEIAQLMVKVEEPVKWEDIEEKPDIQGMQDVIDQILIKMEEPVRWENIENRPDIKNIEEQVQQLVEKVEEPVKWEDVEDKPQIGNSIQLEETALVLLDDENDEIALVPLTTDDDIDIILGSLDYLNYIDDDDRI